MNSMTLAKISELSEATLDLQGSGKESFPVSRICTDSRELQPGDLFVALRGERFDGHAFLTQAAQFGAVAAMISEEAEAPQSFPVLRVKNPLKGLQTLAKNYLKNLSVKVVGVTGSNGKTSTKDFLEAVLSTRFSVLKTEGNLNNQIGLPLTILRMEDYHQIAILEMGMSHPGDISELVSIAHPDVGVITGIGITHLEFMKTQEAIALEKGRLIEVLDKKGLAVLPVKDAFFESLQSRTCAEVIGVGIGQGKVSASHLQFAPDQSRFQVTFENETREALIPVTGEHMVGNALLAIAVGLHFQIPLSECVRGLRETRLTAGRLQVKRVRGVCVLDDSYNANPDSMIAALKAMSQLTTTGRRIAVLGKMGELGSEEENGYRKVGKAAGAYGVDILITVGTSTQPLFEAAKANKVATVLMVHNAKEAAEKLYELVHSEDLLLIKGSRSARMEDVLKNFTLNT